MEMDEEWAIKRVYPFVPRAAKRVDDQAPAKRSEKPKDSASPATTKEARIYLHPMRPTGRPDRG